MPERKPHLLIEGFSADERFQSRRRPPNPEVPARDRAAHGGSLVDQYSRLLDQYEARREHAPPPITEDAGVYVEIIGAPDCELPLDSLDTVRDFKLYACQKLEGQERAVVFIPEPRRQVFLRKLEQYLDPDKDGRGGPRNHILINSIVEVKLADLRAFWTDDPALFPGDPGQEVWWELWLKNRPDDEIPREIADQLAERIGARLANTALDFFDSTVVLIKASASQLERAPELIANLEELRRAKDTPNVLLECAPKEQQQWLDDLNQRIQIQDGATAAVAVLDGGVNYHHGLLRRVSGEELAERWHPDWPLYDAYDQASPFGSYNDHGSLQAGLAAFGDLHHALMSDEPLVLNHRIESGRILPPTGQNDPELYGAITVDTAEKMDAKRSDWRRVYSLGVTADPEREGGQPSSWSAEIDQFSSGMEDGIHRLFVISAGNNRHVSPLMDCWDQACLSEIEDPAQSWNALTVGAFTEKTTNDDPTFDGWSPLAHAGDVAPASCSSVNWRWRKHAPYRPDVVAEGGNRLLSPAQDEVTNADVVSLLTTSGRTEGQLFETTADTSAACALISGQAAQLMVDYPGYWPETIRALLVHSAEWTPRMLARFGMLHEQHSPRVAKQVALRTVGFGVPDLERARYSADNALTLIAQDSLQPFSRAPDAKNSTDPKLYQMQLYQLPWPEEILRQLPPELELKLRVTLSYFIEPNPGRRGYRRRYSYQSHGLRFEVIRPGQSLENFRASINALAEAEEYDGPEGDADGWRLGPQLRTRGSLHSDTWTGSAADLADMNTIAVYPVGGWWKYRTARGRWQKPVRYSLVVSIDAPDQDIDIYSEVENLVSVPVGIDTGA